jgi:S-DNA-T family DNA segregation ATPase FtsK/SpoIIIE
MPSRRRPVTDPLPSLASVLGGRRPRLRSALVGRVTDDIAAARAMARADLAAADAELAMARAAATEARRTAAAVDPDEHEQALDRIDDRYAEQRHQLVRRLVAAASLLPASATAAWPQWTVNAAPSTSRAPELLRAGALPTEPSLPALVPLLDRGHVAVELGRHSDAVIAGLLLRAVGSALPGSVRLSVYDPDGLGATLAGFMPLRSAGLIRVVGPGGLPGLLDDAIADIQRVHERVLAGDHATLREHAFATGRRPEPWHLVVLLGTAADASEQIGRIVRTGASCGVHLIARGPIAPSGAGAVFTLRPGSLRPDPAPPIELTSEVCRLIADLTIAGPVASTLRDLLPEKLWMETSTFALNAPIGAGVDLILGDNPPHALIGGPSGSGKTNLIYAWLASLTSRYSPDELALYLLDFKEGVSFARFAPGRRDPSWLPHVRLVGVNINNDREFGLALLRHLSEELRRRAAAARAREATKLSELRLEDPGTPWPRMVAVIDEFQVLLSGRDAVTNEAVMLLEDLARRGRSQGIHLVLASQDVAGIEALWGRGALMAQFALRIALPKARRVLSDINVAAEDLPRHHAIVNAEAGAVDANRTVRLPDAGDRNGWDVLQRQMFEMRSADAAPPRLFDGDATPRLTLAAKTTAVGPYAIVGARIDVREQPAVMTFGRTPGRNLAVLGSRTQDACAVLASAAHGLARHAPAGPWTSPSLRVVCFDPDARDAALAVGGRFYEDAEAALREPDPGFLLAYAVDAAPAAFRTGLREILHHGPSRGVHVLGWWRSVSRLRDDLGGAAARTDPIGGWVALDVHGAELAPFCPIPGGPAWYPRAHRALFFDRAVHRAPEIVIPYG